MSISAFRRLGAIPNARVLLDPDRDELRTRRQTVLNRVVDWIRDKVTPNPLARTARSAPHNRFLRAIAESPAYDAGDVSRAGALLSVDLLEGKALTTRRIAEVLDEIDGRSTQTIRDNRTTVAWMSTRGVEERLRERSATELPEEERRAVADRVARAIRTASRDGVRTVGFQESSSITAGVVDVFLAEKAAQAEAEAAERAAIEQAETQDAPAGGGDPPEVADPVPEDVPSPVAPQRPVTVTTSTVASATRSERVPAKVLLRELNKAKLPAGVAKDIRRLVKSGTVTDRTGLAGHANRRTAAWVMENRVGRWYGEALKRVGARQKIKHGELLMASSHMLDKVNRSIIEADRLLPYAEIKGRARALIADHVGSEVAGGGP